MAIEPIPGVSLFAPILTDSIAFLVKVTVTGTSRVAFPKRLCSSRFGATWAAPESATTLNAEKH